MATVDGAETPSLLLRPQWYVDGLYLTLGVRCGPRRITITA